MQPCEACKALVGAPSTTRPHPDLAAAAIGAFHRGSELEPIEFRWRCNVCGTWMYQNTQFGEPPEVWVTGERPANWQGHD